MTTTFLHRQVPVMLLPVSLQTSLNDIHYTQVQLRISMPK